jgi:hypothetical protein
MKYLNRARWQSAFSRGPIAKIGSVLALIAVLSISEVLVSTAVGAGVSASSFDMSGTITDVLTPSSVLIGKEKVDLVGVDSSDLNSAAYAYLMIDLKEWLIGKEVYVKGNRVYFDLNGAYNSVSINEMIQKDIADLWYEQYYNRCYYCELC